MDAFGELRAMVKKINNKGIAVIFLAISMIALVGLVGLAVDIGYMYVAKGQLQNAADAAALAGAQKLDPNDLTTFDVARAEAKKFAESNKVAGLLLKIKSDGSNSMSNDNDITLGHWDCATRTYQEGTAPYDAVRVRTRRTAEAEQGQVAIFFGKIFALLPGGGSGWQKMSAAAEATAGTGGFGMAALTICVDTCSTYSTTTRSATSINLKLQDPNAPAILSNLGLAWTSFSNTQAPEIGNPNGDVAGFIKGTSQAPADICSRCITTNNGIGADINLLDNVFRDQNYDVFNKDYTGYPAKTGSVTRWRVAVPVLDGTANNDCTGVASGNGCPPGGQGVTERYHISRLAMIEITDVVTSPKPALDIAKGIMVDWIYCIPCPTSGSCPSAPAGFPFEFKLGNHVTLLK